MEMEPGVAARCEVDRLNEQASLAFGGRESFVLGLDRTTLEQLVTMERRAVAELDTEGADLTVL
ncbi:hypothetical protein [Actinopolyspora mortivallis]|uniref:Uncharacterized protein n=1 Tax=Actinopolyspora mortivallis TaxID=33906 RepID=A0A2T0H0X1_ACTMO|nr:hypothetical protein [Actinopolyspora mortivallis]PRW64903.1 hypothetical protein CEP50_03580 [Actinopolyspora mortivallis]